MIRFYLMGIATLIAQVFFAVHAGRRGRYYWIFIIIFFPVVGCAVYFFLYVMPYLRVNETIEDTGDKLIRIVAPTNKLIKLKQQLEFSDTLKNRQLLADEYFKTGGYEDAVKLYESCLEGAYESDPYILFDLSTAQFMNRSYENARDNLLKIKRNHPTFIKRKEASLLLARTYEELNEIETARREYKSLLEIYIGDEARCRYALFLKKNGSIDEAAKIFNEILLGAQKSPRYYRKEQKPWIDIARKNLGESSRK